MMHLHTKHTNASALMHLRAYINLYINASALMYLRLYTNAIALIYLHAYMH